MIYLLYHRRRIDDELYDNKVIGVYSSQNKAISTMNRFSKLPGFSDFPADFCIESFSPSGKIKYSNRLKKYWVYLVIIEKLIDDEEVTESYDVYTSKMKAQFKLLFKIIYGKLCKKNLFYIEKYYVDEDNWCEGFVTIFGDIVSNTGETNQE